MEKEYTLEEIKAELDREICLLEEKDPSWLNCRQCPFKGKCCIDNDIDIREDEWVLIKERLDSDPEIYRQVKDNLLHDRKCYFRTERCCLIHEVRPTNCIYTPYQVIQNVYDHKITYSLRDAECNFTTVTEDCDAIDTQNVLLELKDTGHTYLFLNHWYFLYENQSVDCYKMTGQERLKEYFHID